MTISTKNIHVCRNGMIKMVQFACCSFHKGKMFLHFRFLTTKSSFANYKSYEMSTPKKKKRKVAQTSITFFPNVRLPDSCGKTKIKHINSIYVGTILRIYAPEYGNEGQLATAHWATDKGLFCTLHDEQKSSFVKLKYKTFVVDHRLVRPGSYRLYKRTGTDDINDNSKNKTFNEIKQSNSKIFSNNIYMDFPSEIDRQSYNCSLFRLTCNCGLSKKVFEYTCAGTNTINPGRRYYGCVDRYGSKNQSCNFFVWCSEVEHETYQLCECDKLCKKINVSEKHLLPVYKFVCINRSNKYHPGCKVYMDA